MKPGLQVRAQQQLALTPQLQQAIRLLQMSTLELGSELRELAEANPLLELDSLDDPTDTAEVADYEAGTASQGTDDADSDAWDDAPTDEALQFAGESGGSITRPPEGEGWSEPEARAEEDLRDHLQWQVEMSQLDARQRVIAAVLIDALDEDGYLRVANDEIRAALHSADPAEDGRIEAVRRHLMTLDPTGVGARDLGECLDAQLQALPADDDNVALARRIVRDEIDRLARNDVVGIARGLQVPAEQVPAAIELIRHLDPKPGASFDTTPVEYIVPDAYAVKRNGIWQVSLNPACEPRLELNQHYCALISQARGSDASYLRGQLQEARWLLKSLASRAETIRKVATAIVAAQTAFLDFGPEAMQPLVLREVAEAIDMHESTVSRVTTRKYLYTPRGIFEFKFFFSSGVQTSDGGSASATAVQALIRRLVDREDSGKPLSDQALVAALDEEGIQVARRTVAKYRRLMRIPNSSQRVQMHP